jgi:hypothetical protein
VNRWTKEEILWAWLEDVNRRDLPQVKPFEWPELEIVNLEELKERELLDVSQSQAEGTPEDQEGGQAPASEPGGVADEDDDPDGAESLPWATALDGGDEGTWAGDEERGPYGVLD